LLTSQLIGHNQLQHQHRQYTREPYRLPACIDYFLARCVGDIMSYKTLDPATNLSDHRPIAITVKYGDRNAVNETVRHADKENVKPSKLQRLR